MFGRSIVYTSLAAVVALGAAGCGAAGVEMVTEKSEADIAEVSEAVHAQTLELGRIQSGQTRSTPYANPPLYRSYRLRANGGDTIDAWVRARNADAMAWITTASGTALAANDDAGRGTLDAHVTYTIDRAARPAEYLIVFREYSRRRATIGVSLQIRRAVTTCSYGGNVHQEGDSFPATDGCNHCSCGPEGNVACTRIACPVCNPDQEPNRNYIGHSPDECARIRYVCAPGFHPFANSCGCGCEADQAPACDPANEPNRSYVGSSPDECSRIMVTCIAGMRRFDNACGCGCEPL